MDWFIAIIMLLVFIAVCALSWDDLRKNIILTKYSNITGIPLHVDMQIDDLFEKLKSDLDYPELLSLSLDENKNIVAKCSYTTNMIFIKDKYVFVVPEKSLTRRGFEKGVDNGNCLKEYVTKILYPEANLNPQSSFYKFKARRKRRVIRRTLSFITIAFSIIAIILYGVIKQLYFA